jgi:NDP-sugar pyrophosphorylase family protein
MNFTNEAIVLAGGLGTRLKSIIAEVPKPLAPINGKSFLSYLIANLKKQGISKIHLSIHHLAEKIIETFKEEEGLEFHLEEDLLGTGGAIRFNLQFVKSENIFVFNGDVMSSTNLFEMQNFHLKHESQFTISATSVEDVSRFGSLQILENGKIANFGEKALEGKGFINSGIYLANAKFLNEELCKIQKNSFSIEKDFFEGNKNLLAFKNEGYFFDIGTPKDYLDFQEKVKSNKIIC